MKKLILIFSLSYILSPLFISPVFAHTVGQPPFFKINGQYAYIYPVPLTSIADFDLPQDQAPANYLLNQTINFALDRSRLPAPSQIINQTKFAWELGDGTKGQGFKVSHKYAKVGSVILKITADDGTTPSPQLLESVLLNILPDKNYQLPVSSIKVNGASSRDPLTDVLQLKFSDELEFDGTSSLGKSAKLISWFWDFGDQATSHDPRARHSYAKDLNQVFPLLRVVDENGFITDSFLEIQNSNLTSQNAFQNLANKKLEPAKKNASSPKPQLFPIILTVLFLAGITLIVIFKQFKKRTGT